MTPIQPLPCNQLFTSSTQLNSNKSEGPLHISDTLDPTQNKAVTAMHATVKPITSDPRLPQNPWKQHDEFPCEHHHEEPTTLSPLLPNIYPPSIQTPKPNTTLTPEQQQLPNSILNAETNLHRHEPESVSEGKYTNQQSIFLSSSSHNGRSSTASESITSNIHILAHDHRPSSPILIGNGTAGICSNIHSATQQSRGGVANTKSDPFSENSDRRNKAGNGSLQSKSMVYDPDSSPNGTIGFKLHPSAMAISNGTDESSLGPNSQSITLLPTPSYGSGLCTLVPATGLIQSTPSIFKPTESSRESYPTKQSSTITSSISTRTRQRYKRGTDSNSCGDEGDKNKILVVKRDPILHPERTVRKKFILKCPPEMVTCSLNFSQTTNPEVGKYAMVIIPTLLQLPLSLDPMTSSVVHPMTQAPMSQPRNPNSYMNFLVWNSAVPRDSSTSSELRALLQGLQLAYSDNLVPLEVEVDSQDIITLLYSNNVSCDNLTSDCRYFLDRLGKPVVLHAYREQNGVADKLAKAGCNFDIYSTVRVLDDSPDFAWSVFEQERSAAQGHI
ncbi:hypothetical protein A4A49_02667 [Nicotiana attenuata]|uniref:RNase H type-1 domain-containing protein n=1 Tax=Nicotiana attenuata TaxID=49451 RepID=A0A1J6IWM1_NICAT|nr:hypothetical protein A4A49_02667 [Nicotiana attenuata]